MHSCLRKKISRRNLYIIKEFSGIFELKNINSKPVNCIKGIIIQRYSWKIWIPIRESQWGTSRRFLTGQKHWKPTCKSIYASWGRENNLNKVNRIDESPNEINNEFQWRITKLKFIYKKC